MSFLPPGILGHDHGRRAPSFSRDHARELLHRAGLQQPIHLRAVIHPLFRDRYSALTEALFAEWAQLGVEVEDTTPTMEEYLGASSRESHDIDFIIRRGIAEYDDPDDFCVPEGSDRSTGPRFAGCAGTGPFRVVRFDSGERLELERNPEYWRAGFPKSDRLVFHFGQSSEAAAEDFRRGRLTLTRALGPTELEALRRDPELRGGYREAPLLGTRFLALNPRHGAFADQDLRRALARALELEAACATAGRLVTRAHGLIPPGLLGHEPRGRTPLAAGTEALRGLELRVTAAPPYHGTYAGFWNRLCQGLRDAGVHLEEISFDFFAEDFQAALADSSPDLLAWAWHADYPDADGMVGTLLHSEEGHLGFFYGSPALDPLIEAGRSESDPGLRHAIYREIEKTIAREAILIPLFHEQIALFCRPGVEGLRFGTISPQICYDELLVRG